MVLSQENTRAAYAKREVPSRAPRLHLGPKHIDPAGHALPVTGQKYEMAAVNFQIMKRSGKLTFVKACVGVPWRVFHLMGFRPSSQICTKMSIQLI